MSEIGSGKDRRRNGVVRFWVLWGVFWPSLSWVLLSGKGEGERERREEGEVGFADLAELDRYVFSGFFFFLNYFSVAFSALRICFQFGIIWTILSSGFWFIHVVWCPA